MSENEAGAPDVEAGVEIQKQRHDARSLFMFYAAEFVKLQLVDGGRSLQARNLGMGMVAPAHAMKLHLSPIETRHEKILRALVTGLSAAMNEIESLQDEVKLLREPRVVGGSESGVRDAGPLGVDQGSVEPRSQASEAERAVDG